MYNKYYGKILSRNFGNNAILKTPTMFDNFQWKGKEITGMRLEKQKDLT